MRHFRAICTFFVLAIMIICGCGAKSITVSSFQPPMDNYKLQRKFPALLVMKANTKDYRIALTFDDGPDTNFTPKVLDVLKKHHVKATFFLLGSRVDGHPQVVKRIHEEGHVIGNHTYWHPQLYRENLNLLRWEAAETDKAIKRVVGYSPKLFRAPYGGLTDRIVAELGRLNYSVIGWNVDSLDWKQLSSAEVQKNVLGHVTPGSIILMHSGGNWNQDLSGMVQALDVIIPKLRAQGFEFVTVTELLGLPKVK